MGQVQLRALPAGRLEGSVRVPSTEEVPESLSVRFEAAPESGFELPQSVERCHVVDGRFKCKVPAGRLDLKLHSGGFIPHYLWATSVPREEGHPLGRLDLLPGSSVVGWIELPDKAFDFADCSVEMAPAIAPFMEPEDRRRHASVTARAKVSSRGFFQLAGVSPGRYTLSALHPQFAPAPATRAAWLTILPPGFAVTQRRVTLPSEDPVIVPVLAEGGTVTMIYPEPPGEFERNPMGAGYELRILTLLVGEAVVANPITLGAWGKMHSVASSTDRFVVPMLEPGPYSVCYGSAPAAFLYRGAPLPAELQQYCAGGYLAPHSELILRIPAVALEAQAEILRARGSG